MEVFSLFFSPRCLLLLCFFVVVVSGQQRDEEQQQREMEEDKEVVLGVNNDAIRKALRETFPSADDLERASFLAGEIQEELNVTDADAFDVQTFADVEADGLRVVTESFVATTLATSENNYSMKFVAVSEQLTPNAFVRGSRVWFCAPREVHGVSDDGRSVQLRRIRVRESGYRRGGNVTLLRINRRRRYERGRRNRIHRNAESGLVARDSRNETSLEGDDDSEGSKEPPLLLHIALVRLPPTPEEDQKQTPARKLLQGLGGGIGFWRRHWRHESFRRWWSRCELTRWHQQHRRARSSVSKWHRAPRRVRATGVFRSQRLIIKTQLEFITRSAFSFFLKFHHRE